MAATDIFKFFGGGFQNKFVHFLQGPAFIQDPTSIPESRVRVCQIQFMLNKSRALCQLLSFPL